MSDSTLFGVPAHRDAWHLRAAAPPVIIVLPLLGAALVAIASRFDRVYLLLVREDALLEWAQVLAYLGITAIAVGAAPRLWRRGDLAAATVVLALGSAALVGVGEELAWGQRLLGFETPGFSAGNRQGELTLHNDARLEGPLRVGLLLAGLYGLVAPLLVRRRTPFVPPCILAPFFAVVVGYFAFRLLFLEQPTYVQAKYSEWPEFCFAVALVLWCAELARSRTDAPRVASSRLGQEGPAVLPGRSSLAGGNGCHVRRRGSRL